MTIKIIKEGKIGKFTKTCPNCGCEFEYGQGDIKYGTYVICPCCGKHLSHNGYIAYYNNPSCGKHLSHNGYIAYYNNPNKPNPKYTITGDSPCDWYINWYIKRNLTYK